MKSFLTTISKYVSKKFFQASTNESRIIALQHKLEEATQKFEILVRASNEAIRECNLTTRLVVWNHGLRTLFGYSEFERYSFEDWSEQIHPMDKPSILKGLDDALTKKEETWSGIYRFKCASGVYKYAYDRVFIVYQDHLPVRMIGTMQDIDERMTSLAEIERLSLVASKTDNLVIITDGDEKIEWVNDAFIKRTGYALHEVIGQTIHILQGAQTDKAILQNISTSLKAHKPATGELLNYTKDGSTFWANITANPVLDETQRLVRCIVVETDVTNLKVYEQKITAIALELSNLIENANAIIFGVDQNFYVNEWNSSAISTTGYSKKEVIGKNLAELLFEEEQRAKLSIMLQSVLDGGVLSLQEFPIKNKMGSHDILLISATPRKNENGEITGLIAVGQDITELTEYRVSLEEKVKERTHALEISLKKEKELAEMKSKFVSIASHEFRTPLASISVSADALRNYYTNMSHEEIQNKLIKIGDQVNHMTSLLEDVLTLGKSEVGTIKVKHAEIDLKEFIADLVEEVTTSLKVKREIHYSYAATHRLVEVDQKLMRNIVINLLTNALKFSPDHEAVSIRVTGDIETLTIEVIDKGIGIKEEELDTVFEAFQRGTNVSVIEGTGLGLSIIKKAVELMKGTIQVQSKVNEGSCFTVKIPVQ